MERIKVGVRLRPASQQELELTHGDPPCAVKMNATSMTVLVPQLSGPPKPELFACDMSYWSFDSSSPNFASQEVVYSGLGRPLVTAALEGISGCMCAFGQTGSGKSYSMLGSPGRDAGIIRRAVDQLFEEKQKLEATQDKELRIWISYLEIYNENLRDLLSNDECDSDLKVVDHPGIGVHVPGLSEVPCQSVLDVQRLVDFGTRKRAVNATQLIGGSSRSHTVFSVRLERFDGPRPKALVRDERKAFRSRLDLVDFAGAERTMKTRGHAVSHSLSMLNVVVRELQVRSRALRRRLAAMSSIVKAPAEESQPPFRASQLTLLMRNALGGNCKTCLLATVSPSFSNVEETLFTMEFATVMRDLVTAPVPNRETTQALIEGGEKEIQRWKDSVYATAQQCGEQAQATLEVKAFLQEQEHLIEQIRKSYEVHLEEANHMERARAKSLRDMTRFQDGLSATPYLLNMSDDPTLVGCLLYWIVPGSPTTVGKAEDNNIRLTGLGISDQLCELENRDDTSLIVRKLGTGRVVVAGQELKVDEEREMCHGDRIFFGRAFGMKVVVPIKAAAEVPPEDLLLHGSLEDEWCAIEESISWENLKDWVNQVRQQTSEEQADELWREVRGCVKVCDEANDLASEVQRGISFEVDVTSTVPAAVIVRVSRLEASGDAKLLYIWSAQEMAERLDCMRDWYHAEVQPGGRHLEDFEDPWGQVHPADVTQRICHLKTMLEDMQVENQCLRASYGKPTAAPKTTAPPSAEEDAPKDTTSKSNVATAARSERRRTASGAAGPGSSSAATGQSQRKTLGASEQRARSPKASPLPRGGGSPSPGRGAGNLGRKRPTAIGARGSMGAGQQNASASGGASTTGVRAKPSSATAPAGSSHSRGHHGGANPPPSPPSPPPMERVVVSFSSRASLIAVDAAESVLTSSSGSRPPTAAMERVCVVASQSRRASIDATESVSSAPHVKRTSILRAASPAVDKASDGKGGNDAAPGLHAGGEGSEAIPASMQEQPAAEPSSAATNTGGSASCGSVELKSEPESPGWMSGSDMNALPPPPSAEVSPGDGAGREVRAAPCESLSPPLDSRTSNGDHRRDVAVGALTPTLQQDTQPALAASPVRSTSKGWCVCPWRVLSAGVSSTPNLAVSEPVTANPAPWPPPPTVKLPCSPQPGRPSSAPQQLTKSGSASTPCLARKPRASSAMAPSRTSTSGCHAPAPPVLILPPIPSSRPGSDPKELLATLSLLAAAPRADKADGSKGVVDNPSAPPSYSDLSVSSGGGDADNRGRLSPSASRSTVPPLCSSRRGAAGSPIAEYRSSSPGAIQQSEPRLGSPPCGFRRPSLIVPKVAVTKLTPNPSPESLCGTLLTADRLAAAPGQSPQASRRSVGVVDGGSVFVWPTSPPSSATSSLRSQKPRGSPQLISRQPPYAAGASAGALLSSWGGPSEPYAPSAPSAPTAAPGASACGACPSNPTCSSYGGSCSSSFAPCAGPPAPAHHCGGGVGTSLHPCPSPPVPTGSWTPGVSLGNRGATSPPAPMPGLRVSSPWRSPSPHSQPQQARRLAAPAYTASSPVLIAVPSAPVAPKAHGAVKPSIVGGVACPSPPVSSQWVPLMSPVGPIQRRLG